MTTHNTSALPVDVSASDSSSLANVTQADSPTANEADSTAEAENGSGDDRSPVRPSPEETAEKPEAAAAPVETSSAPESPGAEGSAVQESSSTDDSPVSEDPAQQQPAEKTRRRVQLSPTLSPELAKPVPSIPTPTSPPPTSGGPQPVPSEGAATEETLSESPATAESSAEGEPPTEGASSAGDASDSNATTEPPPPSSEPIDLPPKAEPLDSDIEAQLDAALSGDTGESSPDTESELAAAQSTAVPTGEDIRKGARVTGTVQSIHGDDMFIELGHRMAGVLSRRQFGLKRQPMQGESITVIVNRLDENEGLIYVNLPSGVSRVRGNWEELSVDQTVECTVNATNKGGLEVSVGSLRGFMPASQVELGYVADLNTYVGQKLRAEITEVNPKRRKLVLSRRNLLEVERAQTEQEVFQKIAPGQTYEGRVKTIKDYGAFVDIGGVDGLLHVGQISWSRINHPSDVLTEGQQIEVKVLSVDLEKKKIGLGMRQLSQNPWKTAEEKFTSGTVATGKVTRIEGFGAFIELEPGIEGLVHISELDHQRIKTVHEVLRVGQEVNVQVLEVDPSRKRISLSVKALKEKPEDTREAAEEAAPVQRQDPESLKGGIGEPTGGQLFGDPTRFGR